MTKTKLTDKKPVDSSRFELKLRLSNLIKEETKEQVVKKLEAKLRDFRLLRVRSWLSIEEREFLDKSIFNKE